MTTRRTFLKASILTAGAALVSPTSSVSRTNDSKIKLSLAQWSLHRTLQSGALDHLDFPATARNKFGFDTVEYVNGFFGGKKMSFKEAGKDKKYLGELLQRSKDAGVVNHVIMVDEEGPLSLPNEKERLAAVDNHKKWLEAAKFLGCKTVRVNLHGEGSAADKKIASIDSLSRLGTFAKPMGINVVVENHGHESSDASWVADIMRQVNMENVGTLPDFGNFCLTHPWGSTEEGCEKMYDRYQGVKELLPFAKGVSAKTYDFDENGQQPLIDYKRLIEIVKASDFEGYIGIEFEGKSQAEEEGIRKTIDLVKKYL
ncbi:MAG TPA: sugar phosphate isomerase/epimerase family protein [Cyclobacteriaceae bacterium]|nr:sugar phosphate isomerase/epimerase family protein [Cyclobacteriaceae bacterium]